MGTRISFLIGPFLCDVQLAKAIAGLQLAGLMIARRLETIDERLAMFPAESAPAKTMTWSESDVLATRDGEVAPAAKILT